MSSEQCECNITKHALCTSHSLARSSALHCLPCTAGKSHIAPLVGEMLQRIQAEVARYERVISYWPSFGPSLEAAVCAALRTTTAAVSRQCGLIPMIGVGCLLPPTSCFPCASHMGDTVSHETSWPGRFDTVKICRDSSPMHARNF